jgi:hypothetical protein
MVSSMGLISKVAPEDKWGDKKARILAGNGD